MPGAFGPNEKRRYVELIRRGRRPKMAAEDLGYSHTTVRTHLRTDAEFNRAVVEAADTFAEQIEEVLVDKALDGDLGAIKMYLYNRKPGDWADAKVNQVQITGAGGGPIQLATGTVEMWRQVLQDPEAREMALAFATEVPAIEATAHET